MSSLAGLTIQQILDLDVENLAVKIDKHHCQTKKAVLVCMGAMCMGRMRMRIGAYCFGVTNEGQLCPTSLFKDHFMDTKTRLLSNQVHAVEEERRAGNGRLEAKQVHCLWDHL